MYQLFNLHYCFLSLLELTFLLYFISNFLSTSLIIDIFWLSSSLLLPFSYLHSQDFILIICLLGSLLIIHFYFLILVTAASWLMVITYSFLLWDAMLILISLIFSVFWYSFSLIVSWDLLISLRFYLEGSFRRLDY